MQTARRPYDFGDDNTLIVSQQYCEPRTTTASFSQGLQDSLNEYEPQEWQVPPDAIEREEWHPPQDTVKGNSQDFTISLEPLASPRFDPNLICFGMVHLDQVILLSQELTCYRLQTFPFM